MRQRLASKRLAHERRCTARIAAAKDKDKDCDSRGNTIIHSLRYGQLLEGGVVGVDRGGAEKRHEGRSAPGQPHHHDSTAPQLVHRDNASL